MRWPLCAPSLFLALIFAAPAGAQQDDDSEVPSEQPRTDKPDKKGARGKKKSAASDEAPPAENEPAPDSAPVVPSLGDKYQGVAPGSDALPPHPPKLPITKGPQRMTWPGFQIRAGVPTVFVQLTGAPDYQVAEAKGQLVVTLRNTVVPLRNNRRPLRVGYFNTAVTDVDTRERGHDLQIFIRTKDAGAPAHKERVEAGAGGFQLLVIELPAAH